MRQLLGATSRLVAGGAIEVKVDARGVRHDDRRRQRPVVPSADLLFQPPDLHLQLASLRPQAAQLDPLRAVRAAAAGCTLRSGTRRRGFPPCLLLRVPLGLADSPTRHDRACAGLLEPDRFNGRWIVESSTAACFFPRFFLSLATISVREVLGGADTRPCGSVPIMIGTEAFRIFCCFRAFFIFFAAFLSAKKVATDCFCGALAAR